MSTAEQSPLTSEELNSLESLLYCANERELSRIAELLGSTETENPTGKTARTATLTKYCPHKPWPKQQAFLDLECEEAFFGGAAGGGKSDTLLMTALEYVHCPKYSALILRRDFPRLSLPGSIMDRSHAWLRNTDAKWNSQQKTWRFPSGAVLQFGYIDNPEDRWRYTSSEYQFVGLDEATEFRLSEDETNPYLFMFSRLRRTEDNPVPRRFRVASNPGQIGHAWIKHRFIPDEWKVGDTLETHWKDGRAFVPSLAADNPALRLEEYIAGLSHLPPVTRARLLAGDWTVQEGSLIDSGLFRYWTQRGQIIEARDKFGEICSERDERELLRFATVDTAGTSKEKEAERKGKPASWSVFACWDYDQRSKYLYLRHVWRGKVGFLDLCETIRGKIDEWQPSATLIENAHMGPAIHETIRSSRNVRLMPTVTADMKGESGTPGKVERATPLFRMLGEGRLFFPKYENSWKPVYEGELVSWTGLPDEVADQVDVTSYACAHCENLSGIGKTTFQRGMGVGRIDRVPLGRASIGGWR